MVTINATEYNAFLIAVGQAGLQSDVTVHDVASGGVPSSLLIDLMSRNGIDQARATVILDECLSSLHQLEINFDDPAEDDEDTWNDDDDAEDK